MKNCKLVAICCKSATNSTGWGVNCKMTKMLSSLAVIYEYNLNTSRWQPAELSLPQQTCLTVTALESLWFHENTYLQNKCLQNFCLRVTAASPGWTAIGCLPLGDLHSILTIKGRHPVWLAVAVECSTSGWPSGCSNERPWYKFHTGYNSSASPIKLFYHQLLVYALISK